MPPDPCEKALLERIARGDRKAVETLAGQHIPGLLHYASTCCASMDDAETAVRQALSAALTQAPGSDCVSLRAWLYRLVRNACQGAAPRRPSGEFLLPLPPAGPDCAGLRGLFSDYLDGELSRPDRAAVEDHLGACEDCAALMTGLSLTVQALRHAKDD